MARSYQTDEGETHGLLIGHATPLDPIPLEGDELEAEFKVLKQRLARKIPLGFRA